MSGYDFNIAIIVPEALRDSANRLACAIGQDGSPLPGNTFNAPLSADGQAPATHWAFQASVRQDFLDMLARAAQGQLPAVAWTEYGLTVQQVGEVLQSMAMSAVEIGGCVDFDAFIAGHNLRRREEGSTES